MNTVSTETRKYELKARAERQRETRERITRAAMELHEEIGVAKTTVAEIARRAGVTRLTVYNHFPDDSALLPACNAHYMSIHPPPDYGALLAVEDPAARVRAALRALYGWYRDTEPMTSKVARDRGAVPALEEFMRGTVDRQIGMLGDALAAGFGARGKRAEQLRALLAVALEFWTWQRLAAEGLDDEAAADLMADAVSRAAAG
jgi:AcrR family transcriptional regulator